MKRWLLPVAFLTFLSISSFATPITYTATLNGANESPSNASPGTGFAIVTYDSVTHLLGVQITFSGLQGTTTASHIHCCTTTPFTSTAGVATQTPTFSGFPLGVTSGTYTGSFDLSLASSWNSAFISAQPSGSQTPAGAEAALAAALNTGQSYLNIHSSVVPGGEIRGFLVPAPEPSSMILLGTGALGVITRLRKRSKV